jgi:hypothetical protein
MKLNQAKFLEILDLYLKAAIAPHYSLDSIKCYLDLDLENLADNVKLEYVLEKLSAIEAYEFKNMWRAVCDYLKDLDVKNLVEECCMKKDFEQACLATLYILPKDPEFAKSIMERFLNSKKLYLAGKIAGVLSVKYPDLGKKLMKTFLKKRYVNEAGKIAIASIIGEDLIQ